MVPPCETKVWKPIRKPSLLGASEQLAKLVLAPFLWCMILLLLGTYTHSVFIASKLPRVRACFSLLAWLGVFLAASGLVMFYKCSRKNPGYIMMNRSDLQNIKDDIEMNSPALLAGNWSQICAAACKAGSSVTNNRKLSGRSMDYDGDNNEDPHADEQHFNEEVQTDHGQENVVGVDDLPQDEASTETSWYSSKQDSLVESVLTLQSVQRALQSGAHEYKDEDFRRVNTSLGLSRCVHDLSTMSENESSAAAPPPFDPSQPSIPISYPIKSLKELASRSYFNSFHYPFNKSSVPLQQQEQEKKRPRILVCHDFQGGYSDDKWVQGGKNPDAYAIWHWYLMDVFVYFSHSLVTLPPPCWTNTAHLHGVKVLGTFITEWDEGKAICNELLSTMESAHMYAELLAELAVGLGFDGWLLNFEVVLNVGQIPNLIEFVNHLTKTMRSLLPGSLVIWYDSITTDGELKWQDQLNEKNKPFFDNCDGIFVNYTWKKDNPKRSAAVAGDRKFDVYMGIDVFGRNTYGGGQWNTNVALDVLKKDNVSAAIFAPGWVYETKQPPDFQTAQNRWWDLVEKSWGTVNHYPKRLLFYSNFDQGRGHHISVEGGEVSNAAWNNISSQGFQPLLEFKGDPTSETIEVLVDLGKASYSGGGNITFKGTLKNHAEFTARIFQGEILLGEMPLYFAYSVKSEGDSLVGLSLQFSSTMNDRRMVLLAPGETNQSLKESHKVIRPRQVNDLEMAGGWAIMESSIMMNGFALTGIDAVCYRRKQADNSEPRTESESNEQLSSNSNEFSAALGHISIKSCKESPEFPPSSSWIVEGQFIKWGSSSPELKTLSLKMEWKLKDGKDSSFQKYDIYVKKLAKQTAENTTDDGVGGIQEYLGVANVEAFYISELSVPSSASGLKFIIQACAMDGSCQRLDASPYFLLDVEA